jgi:muramoyltetrapeptide carboxypeptidase
MKQEIAKLKIGDLIYITSPAKAIELSNIRHAQNYLENLGFKVELSKNCLGNFNYFSGSDYERLQDFQEGLDNPNVKAILCARGGYGSVRLIDQLNWAGFIQYPKWIVGYSDITVFHQRLLRYGIPSIHGSMPLNFEENTTEAIESLINLMKGEVVDYRIESNKYNKCGTAKGKLVGGNLSILYSLLATDDRIDYRDTILFIEDLSEHLYHIDRMLYSFEKAGVFDQIKGLIVGGMTELMDTAVPFGMNYQEIILSHFNYRNIPIIFDFPAGHIPDNRALCLGKNHQIEVGTKHSTLIMLD